LLEVGADGVNLMDEILHADDTVLAKMLLDDGVVGKRNALLVDLAITTLVDEFPDGLKVGVAVGNKGFDNLEHLGLQCGQRSGAGWHTGTTYRGLGQPDENTVVDLEQSQKLQGLPLLGINLVDTLDTDNENKLGLGRDIEAALLLRDAGEANLLALCIAVFLDVLLSTLEDGLALLLVGLIRSELATKFFRSVLGVGEDSNDFRPERWLTLRQH
jgi:hypothetical protein